MQILLKMLFFVNSFEIIYRETFRKETLFIFRNNIPGYVAVMQVTGDIRDLKAVTLQIFERIIEKIPVIGLLQYPAVVRKQLFI